MDIDPDSDFESEERKSQQWVTTFNRYRNRLYVSLAQNVRACRARHTEETANSYVGNSTFCVEEPSNCK
jgi:hypothetical protein